MLYFNPFHQLPLEPGPYSLHSTWIGHVLQSLMCLVWTIIGEVRIDLVLMVVTDISKHLNIRLSNLHILHIIDDSTPVMCCYPMLC
jgi:hypothetical protein